MFSPKKISKNFREGFNRLYFILSLLWIYGWLFTVVISPFLSSINFYTDDAVLSIVFIAYVLLIPVVVYYALSASIGITYWIYQGFRNQERPVGIWALSGIFSYFKRWPIFTVLAVILLLTSFMTNFLFSKYGTRIERVEAEHRDRPPTIYDDIPGYLEKQHFNRILK